MCVEGTVPNHQPEKVARVIKIDKPTRSKGSGGENKIQRED
jgi:hypothetical protein